MATPFPISRNGELIHQSFPKRTVDTGINFIGVPGMVTPYEEWEAAVDAHLDLWKWEKDVYPREFKVRVLAFAQQRKSVELHRSDAVNANLEAIAKANKNKGK